MTLRGPVRLQAENSVTANVGRTGLEGNGHTGLGIPGGNVI